MIYKLWQKLCKIMRHKCPKCGKKEIPFWSDMLDGINGISIWTCRNCKTEWI